MGTKHNRRAYFFLFPRFAAGAVLVLGAAVMWLWNAILPALLGVAFISYWQAVGLLILCRLLFGNFSRGKGAPWAQHAQKKAAFREKWLHMNEEERARLREEWRKRCGKN